MQALREVGISRCTWNIWRHNTWSFVMPAQQSYGPVVSYPSLPIKIPQAQNEVLMTAAPNYTNYHWNNISALETCWI